MTEILQFAIIGLGVGAVYALIAQSVVVIYLGSGVLNFAAGAIGMFGAYVFYELRDHVGLATAGCFVASLAACAALGAAMHLLVMRRLANAPQTTRIVATLGLMLVLIQAIGMTWASGGAVDIVVSPLPSDQVSLGDGLSVGLDRLLLLGIAVASCAILLIAQRKTRLGLAVSAVAENRTVAATMGWNPDLIGAVAWATGSMLAAVAIIFTAPFSGLSTQALALLVVPAMAAALLGKFESLPWALFGGLLIAVISSEMSRYVTEPGWETAAPLVLIVAALTLRGRSLPERTHRNEWRASVGSGRVGPIVLLLAAAAVIAIIAAPISWIDPITTTLLVALLLLSVVVLTGYAGQLSLAQSALAGFGAFIAATLAVSAGVPLAAAVPLGAFAAVPLGMLVALPALRTRGSNLAIASLSLAVGIDAVIISNPERLAEIANRSLGRFELFGLDLSAADHPVGFAFVVLGAFVLVGLAVANLRRGVVGRRMLAVRSNERAAAALGVSVTGVKLYAFAVATAIAGFAGALTEARFSAAELSPFPVINNINVVLDAILGGIGWIGGAVLGSLGAPGAVIQRAVSEFTATGGEWVLLVAAASVLVVVLQAPDGLAPLLWSKVRRVVPSSLRRRPSREGGPPTAAAAERPRARRADPTQLRIEGASVRFGEYMALQDVSLTVSTGEIVGLIGPNGAGKSTLIDSITGFERLAAGKISLGGQAIDRESPARRARLGLSRSFQNLELFEDMTLLENLRVAAEDVRMRHYATDLVWSRPPHPTAATQVAIADLGLAEDLDRLPRELDYATRRQAAIARSLSTEPTIVMLDEPAAGLDKAERGRLSQLIHRLAQDWGVGVLLVEHDMELVFNCCDRVVVLDGGHVIAAGGVEEVRRDPAVMKAYLGGAPPAEGNLAVDGGRR